MDVSIGPLSVCFFFILVPEKYVFCWMCQKNKTPLCLLGASYCRLGLFAHLINLKVVLIVKKPKLEIWSF